MKNNYKNSLLIYICVLIITTHAQFRERERPSGSFLGSFINRIRSREPSRAAMERVLLSVQRYQSLGLTLGELRRRNRFVDYVMRAIEERNKNDPFNPGMYSDYTIEAFVQGLCTKTLILLRLTEGFVNPRNRRPPRHNFRGLSNPGANRKRMHQLFCYIFDFLSCNFRTKIS